MRIEPFQNLRFRVEIDGISSASFIEVIMPEAAIDVIEYREGADPGILRKLSGLTKYGNIILKRGVTENQELFDWISSVIERGAGENRRNMSIVLMDEEMNDKIRWNFRDAWPVKYEISDLNAQQSEIVFEILEIAFESFERST